MKTIKVQLERIYKANQCADASDCEIAINEVKELARRFDWTPALTKRLISLENKLKTFAK